MQYNIDFAVCALLFIVVLMVNFFTKRQIPSRQSRMFRLYMIVTFFDVVLDITSCIAVEFYQDLPMFVNYGINMLFLSMQLLVPVVCTLYVDTLLHVRDKEQATRFYMFAPAMLVWVLLMSTPITKLIFYFDEAGYQHGLLHILLYASMATYVVVALVKILHIRKELAYRQFGLTIAMIMSATSMAVAQYFLPNYSLSGVGLALSLYIMYMTIEDPTIYIDAVTNAMNRDGFITSIRYLRKTGARHQLLVVAIDNFKIINEVFGMDGGNRLLEMLAKKLQSMFNRDNVYRYNGDIFVVVLEAKQDGEAAAKSVQNMLQQNWEMNGVELNLTACVCVIPPHLRMESASELIKTVDYSVQFAKARGKGQLIVMDDVATDSMTRNAAIEQAMLADIATGSFEVHYQPIFDTKAGRFHSMEALARLNVPGYGYVPPDEFIQIAEKNGMIMDIGILVLEAVCKFYKGNNLKEKGIDFIEVNLSVVQCMQDNYHKVLLNVLDKYAISPKMINLEITESAAAYSEKTLVENMEKMYHANLSFSMDDYGSGYSNVNNLINMPFAIIKLDKQFVWSAFKNEKMLKVLQNTISMFHDIDLKVVAEGVETIEMAEKLTKLGVEYLQGYYYAKPMTPECVMEMLESK